ncbi:hypothetical protein ACIQF6_33900 [Kitasatospora sp. NPDC092948]|uniref:hypothetical protein n=1 Tax=Kitasatospora sp. NPDC092948 TaxID=3364088 RepID=UPI00381892ED
MKLRLPVQHLTAAVTHTVRAISAKPVVSVMAGLLLETAADGLHLSASDYEVYATDRVYAEVADDGRILVPGWLPPPHSPASPGPAAEGKKKTDGPAAPLEALVPTKVFGDLARAYGADRPLTLHSDGDRWGWSSCGSTIPETTATITAPAAELHQAVQRVALVARDNTPVRLTLDGGLLRIEAGSGDNAHGSERIEVHADGDLTGEYTIAFNPNDLADGIKAAGAAEAVLHVGDNPKPAAITARTGTDDDIAAQPYRYVIMPVRLNR